MYSRIIGYAFFIMAVMGSATPGHTAQGDVITSFTINNTSGDGRVPLRVQGIEFYNGFIWALDLSTDRIYRVYPETVYDTDGTTILHNPGDSDFNIPVPDNDSATGLPCDPDGTGTPQICGGGGLTFAQNFFWNASPVTDDLIKLDPVDGDNLESENTLTTLAFPSPSSITFDGTYFWVIDIQSDTVNQVLPEDGTVLNSFDGPSALPSFDSDSSVTNASPFGAAFDGAALWVSDQEDDVIYRISSADGSILDSFTAPGTSPKDLAWDGEFLWHVDEDGSSYTIYQLDSGVIPIGIIGCVEKNGFPLTAEAALRQDSEAEQVQTMTDGCFSFGSYAPGVNVELSINETGVDEIPVIALTQVNGSVDISLEVGESYVEPGFTAIDPEDGDITASVVVVPDVVANPTLIDTSAINSTGIPITYDVLDSAGNNAVTQTRLVYVTAISYSVGGSVTGLNAGNTLTLSNNASENLEITADGNFTFPTEVVGGLTYAVSIATQPTGQTCTVSNGSGTITADVSNVLVECSDITYSITTNTTGLDTGDTLTVSNNGIPTDITDNGSAVIDTVLYNAAYDVQITTAPTNKTCVIGDRSDPTSGNALSDISIDIDCSFITYTLGGTVTGLEAGDTPDLRLEYDSVLTTISADGVYTLSNTANSGSVYTVAISQSPSNKNCTITNETGTAASDVTNINVDCVDNIPPDTPTVDVQFANSSSPVVTGTANVEASDTLSITIEGATYENATVSGGNWSVDTAALTPTTGSFTPLADGVYDVSVTLQDDVGNASNDETTNELTIDTVAPAIPVVNTTVTNIVPPAPLTITGSAVVNADESLSVSINGATFNNVSTTSDIWAIDLSSATPDSGSLGTFVDGSSYEVVATTTDLAGNTSSDSSANELTIDQTLPDAPATPDLTDASDTGTLNSDNVTNDIRPDFTGVCNDGDTITLYINGASTAATAVCASSTYTVETASDLADGVYLVTVTATDGALNEGPQSTTALSITVDTTAPNTPSVILLSSNDTTPIVSGGAVTATGDTLRVTVNGFIYDAVTVSSNSWSVNTESDVATNGSFTALSDGQYGITSELIDLAGNVATDTSDNELTIDTVAPSTPTVNALTTNDLTPSLTGAAILASGESLTITVNGATYVNVPTNSNVWSVDTGLLTPSSGSLGSFVDGANYEVVATASDAAGNTAIDTSSNELTIDTTPPAAPTVNTLTTNDITPAISGTAVLGSGESLNVTVNGATFENVTVEVDNSWSVDTETDTPTSGTLGAFADGTSYEIIAVATDAANLSTSDVTSDELTIDLTPPVALAITDMSAGTDRGVSDTDDITSDNTPTFEGACVTTDTIALYVDGSKTSASAVCVDSAYAVTASNALTDGARSITVTAEDIAGNEGVESAALAITVDTAAPTTPSEPNLTDASDNGSSNTDNVTGVTTPQFVGTCTDGDWVEIYIGGIATGDTFQCAGSVYDITLSNALSNGPYIISARASDTAGNLSTPSTDLSITIDTTAAAAPVAPDMTAATDSGRENDDNVTLDTTPTFVGSCTNGETIALYVDGSATGDSVICSTSTYTITPVSAFADGSYSVTATATGASGVESPLSIALPITIDTTAPAAPAAADLSSGSDTGSSSTDNITAETFPIFTGSCTDDEEVTLFVDGLSTTGMFLCNASAYQITAPNALVTNDYDITVSATDAAGNQSGQSVILSITVDTVPPATPATPDLAAASDTGVSDSDDITSDTSPTFEGSCTTGNTMYLYIDTVDTGITTVCAAGTYSMTVVDLLSDGVHTASVSTSDPAGNTSGVSTEISITIDTVDPIAPAIDSLITNVTSPVLSGSATTNAGESLQVSINGSVYDNVVVSGGTWSVDTSSDAVSSGSVFSALADGLYDLSATVTDTAGNSASDSSSNELEIDTVAPLAPGAPDLTSATDTGSSDTDNITNINLPSFTGTCTTADIITLYVDAVSTAATTTCAGSSYTVTAQSAVSDGNHLISITATDPAGNESVESTSLSMVVDTVDPATPAVNTLSTNDTTPEISGTASLSAGDSLSVTTNGATYDNVAVTAGDWTLDLGSAVPDSGTLITFVDTSYSITAIVTDIAGNTATDNTNNELTIDTTPPSAPSVPDMTAATDSGSSDSDNITNITEPSYTGACSDGEVITIYVDSVADNTQTCASSTYTITSGTLTEGTRAITATATDSVGNESAQSLILSTIIDVTAPTALAATNMTAATDTGLSQTDNITSATQASFDGICGVGDFVTFYVDGVENGTVQSCSTGSYVFTVASAQTDASYTATVSATDVAGNAGAQSTGLAYTVDTNAPAQPSAPDLDLASDTGLSGTDNITSDTTPSFSGSCTTGERVVLYLDGSATSSSVICAAASYTLVAPSPLADGSYSFSVTDTDIAGNESVQSGALSVTVDTTVPQTPIVDTLLTNDTTPVISGTATLGTGDVLSLQINGASYDNVAVTTGTWSLDTGSAIPSSGSLGAFSDGNYDIVATVSDSAGNNAADSTTNELTIDTTPPAAPSAPDLSDASDTGSSPFDNTTRIQTPSFTGACTNGETLSIYVDGTGTGDQAVCASNAYTVSVTTPIAEGAHTITVSATDAAGNEGSQSSGLAMTIDVTAPSQPAAVDLAASSDTGLDNTDNITSDTVPEFIGSCTIGTTMTLYIDSSATDATACIASAYTLTSVSALTSGTYSIAVTASDLAGNESTASAALSVTVDTNNPAAPSVPDLLAASDSGSSNTDNITNVSVPSFSGTCLTGQQVNLYVNGASSGASDLCAAGTYSVTVPSNLTNAAADGTGYDISVTSTSVSGVEGSASSVLSITFDDQAPSSTTPSLIAASDTGTSNSDQLTNDNTPTFDGSCAVGQTLALFVDNAATGDTASCSNDSDYSITASSSLTDGSRSITATATDVAGNTGVQSSPILSVTIDTNKPSAPTIAPDLTDASDTGTSNSDNNTSDNTPTFAGACTDNEIITLYVDNNKTSAAFTCTGSAYSLTSPDVLSNAAHDITVSVTDQAGNESVNADLSSGLSPALTITVDNGKPNSPSQPDLDAASDSGLSSVDNVTQDSTPTFSGTCVAGSTVSLIVDSTVTTDTAVCEVDSTYSITSSALADGSYSIGAQIRSVTGIDSDPSSNLNIVIDNVAAAVAAPDLLASSDTGSSNTDHITSDNTPTFSGSCIDGEQVVLLVNSASNSSPDPLTCIGGGYNSLTVATALNDSAGYSVQVQNTDLAGNVSISPIMSPSLTIDTTLPVAPTVDAATVNSTPFTITGTASLDAGASLSVTINGATYDNVTVTGGSWSLDLGTVASDSGSLGAFADDTAYVAQATVTDAAGNTESGNGSIQVDTEVAVSFNLSGFSGAQALQITETVSAGSPISLTSNGVSSAIKIGYNASYNFSVTQNPTAQGCWFPDSTNNPQSTISGANTSDFTINVTCDDLTKTFASADSITITEGGANGTNLQFTATLDITDTRQISDINVAFDLAHEWPGDVSISLTSPSGTEVFLTERPGTNALVTQPGQQGSSGGWGCNNDAGANSGAFNVILDDESASGDIEDQCNPINGTFTPSPGDLSSFDGEASNGTWTLTVFDSYASADGGSLENWSLIINYPQ